MSIHPSVRVLGHSLSKLLGELDETFIIMEAFNVPDLSNGDLHSPKSVNFALHLCLGKFWSSLTLALLVINYYWLACLPCVACSLVLTQHI